MFSAVKPSVSSLRTTRLPRPLASCTSATASTNCVRFYAVSASAEKQMKQQEELTAQRIRDRKLANNLDVQHWMQSNSPTGAKNFIIKNENNLHPRNFVVRNQPFPMNPFFKPDAPISNETRNEIYRLYKKDAVTYTPRKLGETFKMSITRITAILRMKTLEDEWRQNKIPVQENLSKAMDKLLGSEHVKANGIRFNAEKLRPVASETIRPFFLMVEEQDNFTPEDAAVLLGKDPFANIQARLNMAADRVFSMKPPALEKSDSKKTLEATPPAGSPLVSDTRFMITDISAEKPRIMVREESGLMREANKPERWWKRNAKPKFRIWK